jgi:hypothetical protein
MWKTGLGRPRNTVGNGGMWISLEGKTVKNNIGRYGDNKDAPSSTVNFTSMRPATVLSLYAINVREESPELKEPGLGWIESPLAFAVTCIFSGVAVDKTNTNLVDLPK